MKTIQLLLIGAALCLFAGVAYSKYVPVYVMLNLDWINSQGQITNYNKLQSNLQYMKQDGNIDGINVDVWWGVVETQPGNYNWGAYETLANLCKQLGLKMQMIMSFHQCGGNVNDDCNIPLPQWVLNVGNSNPDIFYTDREGHRDREYLSLGVDNQNLFNGRTPILMYRDFMTNFSSTFSPYMNSVISEIQVGLGPAGEMRYPAYPSAYWTFPGVGEFQCYDKYMLAMLQTYANQQGQPQWGHSGPDNAGTYNSSPNQTGFFNPACTNCDNYASPYGQFFLNWYSSVLIQHGQSVLQQAVGVFGGSMKGGLRVSGKVSGVHWLYKTPSHAAELTAGYKNDQLNGYLPIAQMFSKLGVVFDFTALELKDSSQPASCYCGPEELVGQTEQNAASINLPYEGENALNCYDTASYQQIEYESDRYVHPIAGFSYLRLSDTLLTGSNWTTFKTFVYNMHNLL